MKEIVQLQGVRKWRGDDWLNMQSTYLRLIEDFYKQYGNFIYEGCILANGTISAGIVMLAGKACPFAGATGVTGAFHVRKTSEQENVDYKATGAQAGFINWFAEACAANDAGAFRLDNAKRFEQAFKPAQADNADTLDGKHAVDFVTAAVSSIDRLSGQEDVFLIQNGVYKKTKLLRHSVRMLTSQISGSSAFSHCYDGRIYVLKRNPGATSYTIEIFNLASETIRTLSMPDTESCSTGQIYADKLYMPAYSGYVLYVFDLKEKTIRTVNFKGATSGHISSILHKDKLYIPSYHQCIHIVDLFTEETERVSLLQPNCYKRTIQIFNGKLYMPMESIIEIFDLTAKTCYTKPLLSNAQKSASVIYDNKLFIAASGTVLEIFDLVTETSHTVPLNKRNRVSCHICDGDLYIVSTEGIEVFDLENEVIKANIPVTGQKAHMIGSNLYVFGSGTVEIVNRKFF